MEIEELANYILWLQATENHVTALLEARRGTGKSWTTFALHERLLELGLDSHWFQRPQDIRLPNHVLWWDDAGPFLYKRDSMKTRNKEAAKTLQRLRGAVPMLIVNVVDIERLDLDLRTDFGVHGQVITHGWIEIAGEIIGPIKPINSPPSDKQWRKEEVLEAFRALAE